MARLALGGLVIIHLGVLLYHLAATVGFPYDLNYGEGYVLNDAVRLSRGETLYVDLQQFPMVRSPYPPLFPLLWSVLLPISGPSFWVGRALSVASLGGLTALVAWNAWRVGCGIWPLVAAVGLVAASPFVYQWAGYARVDLLALVLAVGGVLAAQWLPGRRGMLLAAALCALAIWTKQTAITACLTVALAYGIRAWRSGLAFVALVCVPSLGALVWLNAVTHGEFVRHVVTGNAANPMIPGRAMIFVATFVALHLPVIVAGGWWLRRAMGRAPSPVALYLPIALFAAFSAGNAGSSVNYLLEPVLALAMAAPFVWRAVPQSSAAAAPLFAVLQLALLVHWPNGFGTTYLAESALGHTPTAADAAIGARLDELVRAERGEVIAEPAGFAVRNGLPVYVQPIDLRAEETLGRWSPRALVDALSRGRFALVLTAYNFFPADAERALDRHFSVAETLPSPVGLTYSVYRYQP